MAWVLWIGPGHRIATCVEVPIGWLVAYRNRVVTEWHGRVLGVYRYRALAALPRKEWCANEI